MPPFFKKNIFGPSKQPLTLLPKCGECRLHEKCQSGKMKVAGGGQKKILICGEAPGRKEDQLNLPFIGPSGELLRDTLRRFGVELRSDCHITNALICRPSTEKGKDRTPTSKEIDYCRPNIIKTIQELKPEIIIPLGGAAVQSLFGWLWREDAGSIARWEGWQIPCQKLNCWICPACHPAALLHNENKNEEEEDSASAAAVRHLLFERYIEGACKLTGRPYEVVPDYKKQVEIFFDDLEAARKIDEIVAQSLAKKLPIAFDYETTTLKPDGKKAEIVCCSISNGEQTIAYPWQPEAIVATKRLLLSPLKKIASNQKFEHRWSLCKLGVEVQNWALDTMLAAHVLDNRGGISSIKFQAWVLLGQDSWDSYVRPYLKAKTANEENTIRQCPMRELLIYCGMDSLMEWKVANLQAQQLKIVL